MKFANTDGSIVDKTLGDLLKWKLRLEGRDPPTVTAEDTPAPRVDNDGSGPRGPQTCMQVSDCAASPVVQVYGGLLLYW